MEESFVIQPPSGPIVLKILICLLICIIFIAIIRMFRMKFYIRINNRSDCFRLLPAGLAKTINRIRPDLVNENKMEYKLLNKEKRQIGRIKRYFIKGAYLELSEDCRFLLDKEKRAIRFRDIISIEDGNNQITKVIRLSRSDYLDYY